MGKKLGDRRKETIVSPIKSSGIHAYICTPAYDGKVEANFSQSLAEAAFCAPLYGIRITASVMGNGAFIDLARNVFVKQFLEEHKDCTHLFFIDADLKFEARAFIGLLQANLPICAGIYPRRQMPEDYPFRGVENPEGGGLWFVDDWLQCDRVPTGFLCIRRDVIEAMAADAPKVFVFNHGNIPWVFHTKFGDGWAPVNEGDKFIGEDYGFCDDYIKKYNRPIPVWTNFNFVHGTLYKGNMFEWLTAEKEKHDAAQQSSPVDDALDAIEANLDAATSAPPVELDPVVNAERN